MENYGMKQAQKKKDRMYLMISYLLLNFFKMKKNSLTVITLLSTVDLMEEQ